MHHVGICTWCCVLILEAFTDVGGWVCMHLRRFLLNSLAPGRSECDPKNVIFNRVLLIGIFRPVHDNALRWMPQELTDDKSTLVQVMAWCHQATSHYLSQCWPRSMSPNGVTRPQWVKFIKVSFTIQFQECIMLHELELAMDLQNQNWLQPSV